MDILLSSKYLFICNCFPECLSGNIFLCEQNKTKHQCNYKRCMNVKQDNLDAQKTRFSSSFSYAFGLDFSQTCRRRSMTSQTIINENPMNNPSAPPNSETKDSIG